VRPSDDFVATMLGGSGSRGMSPAQRASIVSFARGVAEYPLSMHSAPVLQSLAARQVTFWSRTQCCSTHCSPAEHSESVVHGAHPPFTQPSAIPHAWSASQRWRVASGS
jgi:hypothetical protein